MTAQTAEQRSACLRVIFLASPPPRSDLVAYADWETSMADARTALCLACGVPPEHITARGFDVSDRSYKNVRGSWTRHIEQWGYSEMFDGPHLLGAFALWQDSRPDLTRRDNWLPDGTLAHAARYPDGCDRPTCDICAPAEVAAAP
jgi:hypothetical protein